MTEMTTHHDPEPDDDQDDDGPYCLTRSTP